MAGLPATVTSPAATAACASARLLASPRRTSSTSSRRRGTEPIPRMWPSSASRSTSAFFGRRLLRGRLLGRRTPPGRGHAGAALQIADPLLHGVQVGLRRHAHRVHLGGDLPRDELLQTFAAPLRPLEHVGRQLRHLLLCRARIGQALRELLRLRRRQVADHGFDRLADLVERRHRGSPSVACGCVGQHTPGSRGASRARTVRTARRDRRPRTWARCGSRRGPRAG